MLITEHYKQLNADLHKSNQSYGMSGGKWANQIAELSIALDTRDVLDYGCGKSTLALNLPFQINQYDPAIAKYAKRPDPADIVVCTDVLEHIEPDCLDSVLDDLRRLMKKVGFFTVATRPARKTLGDGRNAHLIQENYRWWLPRLLDRFEIKNINVEEDEFIVFVMKKEAKNAEDNKENIKSQKG